ncbi:MAG: hypothetical protein ACYSWU_16290 [Planctomycetota bacterium]|jgi:hypothetical protein
MTALQTLAEGLTNVVSQKQETRDRLSRLFYRNAAMNRDIPWGESDETPTTSETTSVTCHPAPKIKLSANEIADKVADKIVRRIPVQPAPSMPAEEATAKKPGLAAKLAPWLMAASALGAGGTVGWMLNNSPDIDPPAVESSLLQDLEDRGYNVPPEGRP